MENAMAMPFGLELVLVFAALAVVAFVACAIPLIFRIWRDQRNLIERSMRQRFPKESHHV